MVDGGKIEVKILPGHPASPFGAKFTDERRSPLNARLFPITPQNLLQYFPDYSQSPRLQEDQQRLADGRAYWCAAVDPETNKVAGGAFVNCEDNNIFSIWTDQNYQRRGVAKQLIYDLQGRYPYLSLDNTAGEVGQALYTKMGFVPIEGYPGRMVWLKPQSTPVEKQRLSFVNGAIEHLTIAAKSAQGVEPLQMTGQAETSYALWSDPIAKQNTGIVISIGFEPPPVKELANPLARVYLGAILESQTAQDLARLLLAKPNYLSEQDIKELIQTQGDLRPERETFYSETEITTLPLIFTPYTKSTPIYTPPEYEETLKRIARADVDARYSRHPFRLSASREPRTDERYLWNTPQRALVITFDHPLDRQHKQIQFPVELAPENARVLLGRLIKSGLVNITQISK